MTEVQFQALVDLIAASVGMLGDPKIAAARYQSAVKRAHDLLVSKTDL